MATSYETTTERLTQQELGACALIQDLLPLYMEGEVSPSTRDIVVEHLARCERCAGFLAGSQSTRAQLRRDVTQRQATVHNDQPMRQAVSGGQYIVRTVAALALSLLGAVGSVFLLEGLERFSLSFMFMGLVLGFGSLAMLMMIMLQSGFTTLDRWAKLATGCVLGVVATAMFLRFGIYDYNYVYSIYSGSMSLITSVLVGLMGFAGVWLAVVPSNTASNPPTR